MKTKLLNYKSAGFPAVALRTCEEGRAGAVILEAAKSAKLNCWAWTAAAGIHQTSVANDCLPFGKLSGNIVPNTEVLGDAAKALTGALQALSDAHEKAKKGEGPEPPHFGLIALADVHTWAASIDPITERWMKEALMRASNTGAMVILVGPDFKLPASWEKFVTCLEFELPSREALGAILAKIEADYAASGNKLTALANGERENAVRAASGLTEPEALNAYALALIEGRAEKKLKTETVYREKASAIKRTGLMETLEPDPRGLDAIGGMDLFKGYMLERRSCFTTKAQEYGLPPPRGVLLVGVPGSGKSLGARCICTALGVPAIRLDMGVLFGGVVGQSEAQTRQALATAEAMAPCVLFIDEIEKGLAGTKGGGELDSGVGRRVLGTILSWLQDRKREVFVYATANQVWQLPPELLRKGRFDEIFYLGLPTLAEKAEIFKIHLEKRGRAVKKFNLPEMAAAAEKFTGSECEEAVISAMYAAFSESKEVNTSHIVAACKATRPLAETMREDIQKIEEWGAARARPASSPDSAPRTEATRRKFGGGHDTN